MKQRLVIVAGTRPEIIKIYPVIQALENNSAEYTFVWSGQHYDFEMSTIFFEELNIREPDIVLNIPREAELAQQVSIISSGLKRIIEDKPCIIYALGDTSTTVAAALASFYSGSIFVHDEAGVRSFDPFMIEEGNRKLADALAAYHFTPTVIAVLNLLREGIPGQSIFLTGSTLVDTFSKFYHKISKRVDEVISRINIEDKRFIVVTIHRRENLHEDRLRRLIILLRTIATKYEYDVVFPIHPHTHLKLKEYGLLKEILPLKKIKLVKPLGYFDFLSLLSASSFVMTDSGGVQQEAYLAGKPILTLRPYTEWIETVILGYNFIVDADTEYSIKIIDKILEGTLTFEKIDINENPMGDGASGRRVARILATLVENAENIHNTVRLMYRGLRYGMDIRGSTVFPQMMGIDDDNNVRLCFDEQGMPFIYINEIIDKSDIDVNKVKCILMKHFYLDDLEHKRKLAKLVRINWQYVDKIFDNMLINNIVVR